MNLDELREKIDAIDKDILEKLEARWLVAEDIARHKAEGNLPVFDEEREKILLEKISEMSAEGFDDYNLQVFKAILAASKEHQENVIEKELKQG